MNLHLYRKRKLANRPESAQQKPYACSKCHKTFAYMESVKCHAKQSPGCHYADYIVLDPIAPAQPSTSHSHHVMQPHSELMCHSGLGNGLDPAPIESPGLLECCEPAGLARRRPSAHHHAPLQLSENNTQEEPELFKTQHQPGPSATAQKTAEETGWVHQPMDDSDGLSLKHLTKRRPAARKRTFKDSLYQPYKQKEDDEDDFMGLEIEKEGPTFEPAREHQGNTQGGGGDSEEVNLEGLEVEEDVEAQAAAQDDGGHHQKRRRPSKMVRTDTSRSHTWPMGGLCSNDSKPSSYPRNLQT